MSAGHLAACPGVGYPGCPTEAASGSLLAISTVCQASTALLHGISPLAKPGHRADLCASLVTE